MANSLWLSRDKSFNSDTLDTLATQYYASTFIGRPGSREMDQALRDWTDENTGGLLSEYTKNMSIDPDTVLEILSTIYFKAAWTQDFSEEETTKETFHGTAGDTMVDMMHRTDIMGVYRSDRFTSVGLMLNDSGSMFFILPDDDINVNELTSDPDIIRAIRHDEESEKQSYPEVHLGVPKFKVSGKCDLIDALQKMGVTDAMDVTVADFTPLTTDSESVFLNKAEHAAMIETDEHGVTGAAYTELAMTEGAAIPDEEIDLVIDRPFMFIVTGCDGSILFSGIVRNID